MSAMTSQITSLTIAYSTVYSRRRSKKTSKLRVTGLSAENSPVTGEFPAQMASTAEFDTCDYNKIVISLFYLLVYVIQIFRRVTISILIYWHTIQTALLILPCDRSTCTHTHTYISIYELGLIYNSICNNTCRPGLYGWDYHIVTQSLNTFWPKQYGCHFADDTLKRISLNENVRILIEISLKFIPKGPIDNKAAMAEIMAWRRAGDRPLSETMMARLSTHICVTAIPRLISRPDSCTDICVTFHSHGLISIPAWISNHMPCKMWDGRLHGWSLGVDTLFHPTLCNGCNYFSMLRFELIHVSKRGPRSLNWLEQQAKYARTATEMP